MLFNRTALGFIIGFSCIIALSFAVMVYAGKHAAEQEAQARRAAEIE